MVKWLAKVGDFANGFVTEEEYCYASYGNLSC